MKKLKFAIILLMAFSVISPLHSAEKLTIVTENYPPFNYLEKGVPMGISSDIVKLMLEELKIDGKIQVLPWARAYRMALSNKNVMIFTIIWSKERENLFKWGETIMTDHGTLISKKSRNIKIKELQELNGYRIGVVIEDIHEQILKNSKIKGLRLSGVSKQKSNYYMLKIDRVDLWGCSSTVAKWIINSEKDNLSDYVESYRLFDSRGCYAFSRSTPDSTVEEFNKCFRKLKKEGKIDAIIKKYLEKQK